MYLSQMNRETEKIGTKEDWKLELELEAAEE